MTAPIDRHGLKAGYYEVDFPGRLRLTHYPSGFTCLRHDWMTGRDSAKWVDRLRECADAHPDARHVFNVSGDLVGDIRDMPAFGGGFAVGDLVVTHDPESGPVARKVIAAVRDGDSGFREADDAEAAYLLEDGSALYFSGGDAGWLTTGTDGRAFTRARRIVEGEDADALRWPAGSILASALTRLGKELGDNRRLHAVACSDESSDAYRERYAALVAAFAESVEGLGIDPYDGEAYDLGLSALADADALIRDVRDAVGPKTPANVHDRAAVGRELAFIGTVTEGLRQRGPLPESAEPGEDGGSPKP